LLCSVVGPARVSDLAAERERPRELGVDLWPRLRVMTDYVPELVAVGMETHGQPFQGHHCQYELL